MAFCPNCGAPFDDGSTNCNYCGWQGVPSTPSVAPAVEVEAEIQPSDVDLQSAYISGKTSNFYSDSSLDYYLRAFKSMDLNGKPTFKFKWNWASFLLGGWHLMYRRNYISGIITLILFSVLPGWGFLLNIVLGGCSNYLIYTHYTSKLAEFQSAYPNNKKQQMEHLADIGGKSGWVKALIVLYIIVYIICVFGLGALTSYYSYY